jgi:CheY-like chemotaxis protein
MSTSFKIDNYKNIYKLFLFTILLLVILSQIVVQYLIYIQKYDSNQINIAGRQRMLSQRLAKYNILSSEKDSSQLNWTDFQSIRSNFENSHNSLLSGNPELNLKPETNPEILKLYTELTPYKNKLLEISDDTLRNKIFNKDLSEELSNSENQFLLKMDEIVLKLNQISVSKSATLQTTEMFLAILTIIVLIIEIFFLYKPITDRLIKTNEDLSFKKKKLEELSYLLSHKVRRHITTMQGIASIVNMNDKQEFERYFMYIKNSINELEETSRNLNSVINTEAYPAIEEDKIYLNKKTVVLIDDDKLINLTHKKILLNRYPNLEVICFSDPNLGLEYIINESKKNSQISHNLLLDINMPSINGWSLLDKLISQNITPDVYMISSSIDTNDILKSKSYSMVKGFITKPLSEDKLPILV